MAGVPHPSVSPLSTTASPRASPRKTCRTRRRCSMSYQNRAVSCLTEPVIHSYLLYRSSFLLTRAAASPPDVRQGYASLLFVAAASPPDVRQGYALPSGYKKH